MTQTNITKTSEAHKLASKVAGRYGQLALSRAAGEAAMAERIGDNENRDRWTSVIAYIRTSIQQEEATASA